MVDEKFLGVHIPTITAEAFKDIARKERRPQKDIHIELLIDFIKKHGDGNPASTIDQFLENPQMKAVPAFFRSREDWQKYIEIYADPKTVDEIIYQSQSINSYAQNKQKYGSVYTNAQGRF